MAFILRFCFYIYELAYVNACVCVFMHVYLCVEYAYGSAFVHVHGCTWQFNASYVRKTKLYYRRRDVDIYKLLYAIYCIYKYISARTGNEMCATEC